MPKSTTAPDAGQPPGRIWPLRGEFVDAALEQDFRESTLAQVLLQQRTGILLFAALLFVFAGADYLALGAVRNFWILEACRAVVVLLLLGAAETLRRKPTLALQGHVVVGAALTGYLFFFLLYPLRPSIWAFTTGVIMILQVMLYLFVPVRVVMVGPLSLFGILGTALSVWGMTSDVSLAAQVVFLMSQLTVMGYVAALRQQKTARHAFLLRRQLQDANQELQNEVDRRVSLQGELERQVSTDLLTGLANRRALAERFATESARAQRSSEPLSLVMFDLDHFKLVNDTYGHAGGDVVLRGVGQLCIRSFRGVDVAAWTSRRGWAARSSRCCCRVPLCSRRGR